MSLGIKRKKTAVAEPKIHFSWKEAKRQKSLLIWSGIIVIYGIIFYYLPLGGWVMAFQNYRPIDGLLHSEFVGLQKFQQLFSDATFLRVIRNTLAMGVINLVVTFVMALLMVSRVRYFSFKEYGFLKTHAFSSMISALLVFVLILSQPVVFGFLLGAIYLLSGPIYTYIILPRRNRQLLGSLTQN